MRIVVTGAGGFVGRELVSRLVAAGQSVIAVDAHADGIDPGASIVAGDICNAQVRAQALAEGCDALVHLATVPGGAAEADPAASRRVNIDAMYDLLELAKTTADRPRVVFASSIAVFGDPLPPAGVDDATPLAPKLIYAGHKAMMETAVAMMHNRGEIDGVTVRLPGILARPSGARGMKSAFMSDMFHALMAGEEFVCPVSAEGTIWAQSVARCAQNIMHAITMDSSRMPQGQCVTLPALRVTMGSLACEIARQCGVAEALVSYRPDSDLETAFAAQPPLATPVAQQAGFAHDGDPAKLVASALATLH